MRIEATGHGVISLSMDIEEAKTLLETGSLPSLRMSFPSALSAELERAILREDEMQEDMEAQSAARRHRDMEASSWGQPCPLCGRNPCMHGSYQG